MISPSSIIRKLRQYRTLDPQEYLFLLVTQDSEVISELHESAGSVAVSVFGRRIYLRGLLEISNICRNDCLYCGIRKSNANLRRYSLSDSCILDACRSAYTAGFRTFVFQGGEMPDTEDTVSRVERLCGSVHREFPDCAITLSLGEYSESTYRRFRKAGASRYLLRHETADPLHYARLHPSGMSLQHRMQCLRSLKRAGYQTGTGIMTGSPYQTLENILEDILFIRDLRPEMIGLGPFIPHADTVFSGFWNTGTGIIPGLGRKEAAMELALRLVSIFRLMFPEAMIPATTALATISPEGREKAVLAGANVVMPNITPHRERENYSLYDGKACSGAESLDGIGLLESRLKGIGYEISWKIGDYGDFDR